MRRLVIDELTKRAKKAKQQGDFTVYSEFVELLRDIACSISATIRPCEPVNNHKLDEIKFIIDQIRELQELR